MRPSLLRGTHPLYAKWVSASAVVNSQFEQHLKEFTASHELFLMEHHGRPLPSSPDHLSEIIARALNGLLRQAEIAALLELLQPLGEWGETVPSVFEIVGTPHALFARQYPQWRRQAIAEGLRADARRYTEIDSRGRAAALEIVRFLADTLEAPDARDLLERSAAHALLDLPHGALAWLCADQIAPSTGVQPAPLREILDAEHALALLRLINTQIHIDELRRTSHAARRGTVSIDSHGGGKGAAKLLPDLRAVNPLQAAQDDEFISGLWQAVDALKEPHRSYVRGHVLDELPVDEIARRHGVTDAAVRAGLGYALAALRLVLENHK